MEKKAKIGQRLLIFRAGRARHDRDKAVLPTIIWMGRRTGRIRNWMLTLGWWDWSVKVQLLSLATRAAQEVGE